MFDHVGIVPSTAAEHVQDTVANAIYLERGDEPWPVCGRFIEGPMVTPVVPHWIAQPEAAGPNLIVFVQPEASTEQARELGPKVEAIVGTRLAQTIEFVDKQAAFEDFREMFDGEEDLLNSVTVESMPASYRMAGDVDINQVQRLRALDDVFQVTTPATTTALYPDAPPMTLSIPALGLRSPVYPSSSIENLAKGPVVVGGTQFAPAIGGYGSVDGAVFAELNQLGIGDEIVVSLLAPVEGYPTLVEHTRTYRVTEVFTDHVESIPRLDELDSTGATLVADLPGDALGRLVVTTEPAAPANLSSYVIETGD